MRKNILFLLFTLIFFSLSFNLSFPLLSGAFGQEELSIKEGIISPTPQEKDKKVEYQLPYPGLLPDNPLYFAKAIRDAIIDFLIADPLKKADFYLLQADKRLNAGVYLFKIGKSKYNLAESTISKGENYFEKAIAKAKEARDQGMDIDDLSRRLHESSQKHKEVIKGLEKNVDSKNKGSFASLLKRTDGFEKEVDLLRQK